MSLKTMEKYISTNERCVNVVGTIEKGKETKGVYQDGKGYIDEDGNIWIYCGEGKPKNKNEYPYFWITDGEINFSNPQKLIREVFKVENLTDLSAVTIIDTTIAGKPLFNEQEIEDMNASSSFFVPTIYESDDFLKKIVKTVIIEKGIDINRLKVKTGEKYVLANMISALKNGTKMSVIYFLHWMELLGCEFDIQVRDNGEDQDPLKNDLIYISRRDIVSEIVDGEVKDLKVTKYAKHEWEKEDEESSEEE